MGVQGPLPPDRRAETEAGTSIVEVMVATLLLSVGVLALLTSVGAAERATAAGDRRSIAVRMATGELEVIRSLPYDEIGIATGDAGHVARFEGRPTVTETHNRVEAIGRLIDGSTTFEVRRHVTWAPVDVGGSRIATGYKLATVIVTWTDPAGRHEVRQDTGLYATGAGP